MAVRGLLIIVNFKDFFIRIDRNSQNIEISIKADFKFYEKTKAIFILFVLQE